MTVLLVTHSRDAHCTPRLEAALAARGADVVRFDTDLFPGPIRLVTTEQGPERARLVLPERTVDLAEVTAVWNRRVMIGDRLPAAMNPHLRRVAIVEARKVLEEVLSHMPAFTIDPFDVHQRAAGKQYQLAAARAVGFRVPRTCVTNDPDAVKRLVAACPGGVVTKMMHGFEVPGSATGDRDARGPAVMYTSVLGNEDIDALDASLPLCPMTFQEHIPKARELRVTVVGDQLFAAAIDSPAHAGAEVDWRRDGAGLLDAWRTVELPAEVAERVLALTRRLGLVYGAMDLIVTPEGQHVFLEINPGGEYFWLEDHCGLPISAALADRLCSAV